MQESTKHTPFEVMYGRMARLPIDINSEKYESPDMRLAAYQELADPDEEEIQEKREHIRFSVKKNILAAQNKQKKHYDKIHRASECFTVGDTVLKKDFLRKKRKGGKLLFRWQGPFIITSRLGKGLFKLRASNSNKVQPSFSCLYTDVDLVHVCMHTGHIKSEWISFEKISHS